ncbi:MAG: ABC transporter substrate-binding protein [Deltaproteobacteria bacterium]|nr:ABC transporter substrate-binding protein [Deltaproteobacteria bacterium]
MKITSYFLTILGVLFCFSPVHAEDPIKIGAVFSLSSWGALGGTQELNGLLMARDEINAAGGISGRPVQLIVEDTQSDLKSTAAAFRKLIDFNSVSAIVGPNWAEFTEVAVPIAESAKVPFVSPSGYKEGLFENKKFSFTLQVPHYISARPLAQAMAQRGYKSIAVLVTDNAYLEGIFDGFRRVLPESDARITSIERVSPSQSDFRSMIAKIKKSNADAVLALLLEGGNLHNFLTQARQLKLSLPIYSANGIPYDDLISKDMAIAEGVVFFDYLVPGGPEFIQAYTKRFGAQPGFASARAYDALYLIKAAIEQCGVQPAQIRECLSTSKYAGRSGTISFDRNGVLQSKEANTFLQQVKNAKAEPFSVTDAAKN